MYSTSTPELLIEASFDALLDQAADTPAVYLLKAVENIDATFSPGYAAKHPELVAAYIQAAASDFNASTFCKIIEQAAVHIAEKLGSIASSISDRDEEDL